MRRDIQFDKLPRSLVFSYITRVESDVRDKKVDMFGVDNLTTF